MYYKVQGYQSSPEAFFEGFQRKKNILMAKLENVRIPIFRDWLRETRNRNSWLVHPFCEPFHSFESGINFNGTFPSVRRMRPCSIFLRSQISFHYIDVFRPNYLRFRILLLFSSKKKSFVKFTPRNWENARVHVFNPESVCLLAWIPTNLFACSFSAKYHVVRHRETCSFS